MSRPTAPAPHAAVPTPAPHRPTDPFSGVGDDAFLVFVPAIMSVGLLFSIATLVRDAVRRTTRRSRERRVALETATTVDGLLGRRPDEPEDLGLLPRSSYAAGAVALAATAVAVVWAATAYYVGNSGSNRSLALALGSSMGALALVLAWACTAVARRWPAVPPWAMPLLRNLPLTHHPHRRLGRPPRVLTDGVVLAAIGTVVLTWIAKSNVDILLEVDEPVTDALAGQGWIRSLRTIDFFGSTVISIGSVALIAASGFRCRVMALVYPAAFVFSWLSTSLTQELVERVRPVGFGQVQSFPSGHMVQAVFIAGLLPTAIAVLFRLDRRWLITLRVVLGMLVVSSGLIRIERLNHWMTDVIAGALLGMTVVLGAHWVVAHRWWHQRCSSCEWSAHPEVEPWGHALYDLSPRSAGRFGRAGVAAAIGASVALGVGTITVGLPERQADDGLGPAISEPIQIGLAVVVGLAGLASLRWKASAAFAIAAAATALGLVASIEYEPQVAFGITLLLLMPAVLIWLAWQHHATVGAIFALAALTATSLTATALGSREIYGHYFGPTHPNSTAEALQSDAEWLWLGAVTTSEATIVAGGLPRLEDVTLSHWGDGRDVVEVVRPTDEDGIARFDLDGLPAASEVQYAVRTMRGTVRLDRPDRSFRTFADGAQDLVVMAASGARTGSNAAVFDRIVGESPDLWISLGDMHYADLVSDDPDDHLAQYASALSQPGQAALYGSVATAHVWDDHDYGPNDSDSTSPSRLGASAAYRQAVPHYGVDPDIDASIAQAFTLGRVRFVVVDTRSQRTDQTMLGADQLDWLIDELVQGSQSHALVVWFNPNPWISEDDQAGDDWSAYPDERRQIADALAAADVDNLVMVAGDAHMVAIDDGTHSDYSTDQVGGFPVLQAAALDRPGSVKGGPYSHGAVAGSGQFGRVAIDDDGGNVITVRLSGENWEGVTLLTYEFAVDVDPLVSP